jgi:Protein of unknown function (DUF1552)
MKRRNFLQGAVGGSALGLLANRLQARADGAPAKPRFIFVYTPCGREPSWRTGTVGSKFTLGQTMAMFEPYKSRTAIMDGFTTVNFGYHINAHWGPLHTMLGGWAPLRLPGDAGGALSTGAQRSFDHLLADRLGRYSPVRNIVLGGRDRNNGNNSLMCSWIAPKTGQVPIHEPDQAFAALFGNSGSGSISQSRDAREIERALKWEKEVLGLSRSHLTSFKRGLGKPEREQLLAYENHLSEVYQRVVSETPEMIAKQIQNGPSCKVPTFDALVDAVPNHEEYQQHHDLQSSILAAALACGRTQIGVYVMAGIGSPMTLPGTKHNHHNHDDSAIDHYRAFDMYYGDRIKFLLDELAKYPEGDGTLLDNTIVVWTTDIGWTPLEHDQDNIPIYLFGGLPGRKLKMGQYVRAPYDDAGKDRIKALANPKNRRLHEILLTLAHAVGIEKIEGFADPKYVQGLVTDLLT